MSEKSSPSCESTAPSERDEEVLAGPCLADQFPVTFANDATWVSLDGCCVGCRTEIPMKDMRGFVTRPMSTVAVVEAIGVCRKCGVGTRFFYRLHDDMSISGLHGKGTWGRWQAQPTLKGYLQLGLRWLFGR